VSISGADVTESARKHFEDLLTFFGVNVEVTAERDEDTILLAADTDDGGQVIGHRGETLEALQYVVNMMIRRETDERVYVRLDVGGYRRGRLERLETQANDAARKVGDEEEDEITLPQMNAAERRHIHSLFTDHETVTTESRGEDKRRRLVVKRKSG
jgi:spoIIIJ-associated protein